MVAFRHKDALLISLSCMIACDPRHLWRDILPDEPSLTCLSDQECPDPARPLCDPDEKRCVPCYVLAQLGSLARADGLCQARGAGAACAPRESEQAGTCVQCRTTSDCAQAGTPSMGCWQGQCAHACRLHEECESKICDHYASGASPGQGVCVPRGVAVRYVDNTGGCGTGELTSPYCELQSIMTDLRPMVHPRAAVRPAPSVTLVRVFSRGRPYPRLDLSTLKQTEGQEVDVRIYGGEPEKGLASLGTPGQDGVFVPRGVSLTLDGFLIDGADRGVVCRTESTGRAAITLHRSALLRAQDLAIWGEGCDIFLDRVLIRDASNGALAIEGEVRYGITNSFLVKNSAPRRPLVWFDNASRGVFSSNTLAGNQTRSGALDCGLQGRLIEDSIVVGNPRVYGSQVSEACQLQQVVLDADDLANGQQGGLAGTPVFVDARNGDYHLQADAAANWACCIDRAGGRETGHRVDHDGTVRPQGVGPDIGAHEVRMP